MTVHAFDEMSVVTVMPVIAADLGGRHLYGAVFFAYLLVSLVGLVIGGGTSARRGPANAFVLGLTSFCLGLAMGALAPTMGVVVAGRALQGLGGGILSATVLVVVNRGFDTAERPRVMALNSSAWVVPALVAPAAAGAIAELVSWRWVFAGLVPIALLAGMLGVPGMRRLGPGTAGGDMREELVDGVRLATGLGAALAALARPAGVAEVAMAAAGIAIAWAPLLRVLPAGVFRLERGLGASVATKALLVFAFFGTEAFVPLALIEIQGAAPSRAGLALTGAALAWTAGAHLQARFAGRVSAAALGAVGAAGIGSGTLLMLALLEPGRPLALAFFAWSLAGLGMGIAYNTATVNAMAHTPEGGEEATSTALGMTDALGISVATGLGGAMVAAGERGAEADRGAALRGLVRHRSGGPAGRTSGQPPPRHGLVRPESSGPSLSLAAFVARPSLIETGEDRGRIRRPRRPDRPAQLRRAGATPPRLDRTPQERAGLPLRGRRLPAVLGHHEARRHHGHLGAARRLQQPRRDHDPQP